MSLLSRVYDKDVQVAIINATAAIVSSVSASLPEKNKHSAEVMKTLVLTLEESVKGVYDLAEKRENTDA